MLYIYICGIYGYLFFIYLLNFTIIGVVDLDKIQWILLCIFSFNTSSYFYHQRLDSTDIL